jgi:hypothetical protein
MAEQEEIVIEVPYGEEPEKEEVIASAETEGTTDAGTYSEPLYYPVTLNRDQLTAFKRVYHNDPDGISPEKATAEFIVSRLQNESPDLFSYEGLRTGNAPILDYLPGLKDKKPGERQFNDMQIIQTFARDQDGSRIQPGSRLEGFLRELPKQSGGFAGFLAGAKAGYKVQQAIPPVNPLAVTAKVAIPLASGMAGYTFGYDETGKIVDELMGPEKAMLPGTEHAYETGRTYAQAPFILLPWLTGKKGFDFGAATLLKNIADVKSAKYAKERLAAGKEPKLGEIGYEEMIKQGEVAASQMTKGMEKNALAAKKAPKSVRITNFVERMLSEGAKQAREKPRIALATEAGALAGGSEMAGVAEAMDPGGSGVRITGELVGNVGGGLAAGTIIPRTVLILKSLKNAVTMMRPEAGKELRKEAGEKISDVGNFFSRKKLDKERKNLMEYLEAAGVDIDAVIKRLEEGRVYKDELTGEILELTPAQISKSPELMTFQMWLESGSDAGNQSLRKADAIIRSEITRVVATLIDSGDQAALKAASEIMEATFDHGLSTRLQTAADNLVAAIQKTGGKFMGTDQREALSTNLYAILEEQLKNARTLERRYWNNVPDMEATIFKNADGEETEIPQFLQVWQDYKDSMKGSPATYKRDSKYFDQIDLILDESMERLGLLGDDAADVIDDAAEVSVLSANAQKLKNQLLSDSDDLLLAQLQRQTGWDINTLPKSDAERKELISAITAQLKEDGSVPGTASHDFGKLLKKFINALPTESDAATKLQAAEQAAAKAAVEKEPLTMKELQKLRSDILGQITALKKDAVGGRQRNVLSEIEQALLNDLDEMGANSPEYAQARAFSRALNDTFTRTFVGQSLKTGKYGEQVVSPELLLQKLMSGGADATSLRMAQIEDAAKFVAEESAKLESRLISAGTMDDLRPDERALFQNAKDIPITVNGVVDAIVRNAAHEVVDPNTGLVSPTKLGAWVNKNKPLLNKFPDLLSDLMDERKAAVLFAQEDTLIKQERRQFASDKKVLTQLIDADSPTTIISGILSKGEKKPLTKLNQIVKSLDSQLADNQITPEMHEQAMRGLRGSLLEHVMVASGVSGGSYKPSAMYQQLFEPMKGVLGGTTLAEWMVANGVLKQAQADNMKLVVSEMVGFELSAMRGNFEELLKEATPILDLYLRLSGAELGRKLSKAMGGKGGLIEASAGSQLLRKLFHDVPDAFNMNQLQKIFEDRQLLAAFLRKGKTQADKKRIAGDIFARYANMGFNPAKRIAPSVGRETVEDETGIEREVEALEASLRKRKQVPQPMPAPAPQAQPMPMPTPAPQPVPAPAPQPISAAPASPQSRAQYAALFPNDSASQMIRSQQGIASLMG